MASEGEEPQLLSRAAAACAVASTTGWRRRITNKIKGRKKESFYIELQELEKKEREKSEKEDRKKAKEKNDEPPKTARKLEARDELNSAPKRPAPDEEVENYNGFSRSTQSTDSFERLSIGRNFSPAPGRSTPNEGIENYQYARKHQRSSREVKDYIHYLESIKSADIFDRLGIKKKIKSLKRLAAKEEPEKYLNVLAPHPNSLGRLDIRGHLDRGGFTPAHRPSKAAPANDADDDDYERDLETSSSNDSRIARESWRGEYFYWRQANRKREVAIANKKPGHFDGLRTGIAKAAKEFKNL